MRNKRAPEKLHKIMKKCIMVCIFIYTIGKVYRLLFVCLFCVCVCVCTVTDFSGENKASGVKFCMVV